jgi:protein ImuB
LREPLAFILNRLLEQICARLSTRSLATQELRLELQLDPAYNSNDSNVVITSETTDSTHHHSPSTTRFTRTLRLPVPMLDARIFLKLLQLDLRANPPGAPITKIWLSAEPARLRPGQAGLFIPPSPEPEKLELTMARISGIVGEGNVGSAELLDTHRPEGFRMRHFTPRDLATFRKRSTFRRDTNNHSAAEERLPMTQHFSAGTSNKSDQVPEEQQPTLTALRLLRPPLLVTIIMRDGVPSKIACTKDKEVGGNILWQAGPWRSSGDWWEHEPWARDEWDIAVATPAGLVLYRLIHDLLTSRWFLEGTYD